MLLKYENNRIFAKDENDKTVAEVTFPKVSDSVVEINHTFVDSSLRGQGIADRLLLEASSQIREQKNKAILTCSYAQKWFELHPEFSDIVKR